jgi:hypothetical protein
MMKHSRCTLARISVTRPFLVLILILLTFSSHYQTCEASGLQSLQQQPQQQPPSPLPLVSEGANQGNGMATLQAAKKKRFQIHPDDADRYRQAVAAMSR